MNLMLAKELRSELHTVALYLQKEWKQILRLSERMGNHVLKIFGMFLDDLLELFDSNDKLILKST